ncbi:hypothetical protein RhiLY_07828 [Ceratobasidium sp. AG-Ba]|nr:hypothetical protein RhiLY_07828 [Ceratobasidium sp. AG-Ba]
MSLSDGTYRIYNTDVTTPLGSPLYVSQSGIRSYSYFNLSGYHRSQGHKGREYTLQFSRNGRYIIARDGRLQFGTKPYEWRIFKIDTDKWKIVATAEDLPLYPSECHQWKPSERRHHDTEFSAP